MNPIPQSPVANAAPAAPTAPAALLACLLEGLPHAAWVVDLAQRCVVAVNPAAAVLLGQPAQALLGQAPQGLASTLEDLAWWDAAQAGDTTPLLSDTVLYTADGRSLHVTRSIRPVHLLPTATAATSHALVVLVDRSSEQRVEVEREALLAELQATLEATADGILVTDLNGHVRVFNRRFSDLWALPVTLLQQHDDAAVQAWMARSLPDPVAYQQRLQALGQATLMVATDRLQFVSGQVLERVTRPLMRAGRPQGRVWSFRDLTERLAAQERIETLSVTDALTGLANRLSLTRQVDSAVASMRKDGRKDASTLLRAPHISCTFCSINQRRNV